MYEVQITAQSEKKERAKNTSSEAEMLLEDMILNRKLVEQKWKGRLRMMEKSVQMKNAIHEELCDAMHEVSLLDREIQIHRKSNNEQQEKNEKLVLELHMAQNECENLEKKIERRKVEAEVLLAEYISHRRALKEAEITLRSLKKVVRTTLLQPLCVSLYNIHLTLQIFPSSLQEASAAQSVFNNHRKQLERECALQIELEGKIRTQMQQMIVHSRTAKNYQQLFDKLTDTKNEKMSQQSELENEIAAVENKRTKVANDVDALNVTLEDQEKEIAGETKHHKTCEAKLYHLNREVEQNYRTIEHIKNKMAEVAARTGEEDYSPYETKINELKGQRRKLEDNVRNYTQLWLTKQETRVRLTLEYEDTNKVIQKLQMDYTILQKKKTCQDGLMEIENRELLQLENKANALNVSLNKINTQIDENGKHRMLLEEKKTMLEVDFLGRLKEAEKAAAEIHMKYERIEEEKESIYNCLLESEKQIMLWEKKIQLKKEARSEFEKQNEEVERLKLELQNKELQLNRKVKEGEKLLKECEATAVQCCNIFDRVMVLRHTSDRAKHYRSIQIERSLEAQKRNLIKMKKQLRDLDAELKELKQKKTFIVEDIEKKKEEVTEHHHENEAFESEITKLQDDRERSLVLTVALQNWAKRLKMLRDGTSKPPTNTEAVTAAFNKEVENLHSLYEKVQHICRECPENREELRKIRIALEAHMMFLKI
uniref:Coiled-coil domain-containing protein 40 n=1 Tax=Takifugu rubripes TaxID=31033 RepID=A0A674MJ37_TAKRU